MASRPDARLLGIAFLSALALQLVPSLLAFGGYGYHIDELYYIACAKRLAAGYVDHPPLAPLLLRAELTLFGDSLFSLRLVPALTGALTVTVSLWLTARLGGGRFAQAMTATAVLLAPIFLVFFDLYTVNAPEMLLWTLLLAVVVVMIEIRDPRYWVVFGLLSGLALENKHTVVLLGFGVVAGLALTRERLLLRSRWLVYGGGVALALFLPNLVWQVQNGFPSLEFYRNATLLKNRPLPPLHVLWNQILIMNPMTLPIWAGGLFFFWRRRPELRALAWTYTLLLGILVLSASSRPDRIAGLYPTLFAGGAVLWETRLRSTRARAAALGLVFVSGATLAPLFLPLVPPRTLETYVAFLGLDLQVESGAGKRSTLPQWLADRFGWEELASDVEAAATGLGPDEREAATIVVPSYGHAGALELLGRDLPPVISPHNTWHLWGRPLAGRLARGPALFVGFRVEEIAPLYRDVERVGTYRCPDCMPWRRDAPIYLARGPKKSEADLLEIWSEAKHYE